MKQDYFGALKSKSQFINFISVVFSVMLITGFTENAYCQRKDTSYILLKFSEKLSYEGIFNPGNYSVIVDGSESVTIYKVGIVQGDTAVVLYTNYIDDKEIIAVHAYNLKDKSGNSLNEERNFVEINLSHKKNLGSR